jgi:RimJ/RimL family protein N-acetyltransferase
MDSRRLLLISFKLIDNDLEKLWAKNRTHAIICEDTQGIMAYDDEKFVACAIFDSFTVDACNVHWAITNPFVLRRGFLPAICDYLFNIRGRERIFGLVPSDNQKALRLDTHIGMREVARIPDAFSKGVDYIVMRMDKSDCQWLTEVREQEAA